MNDFDSTSLLAQIPTIEYTFPLVGTIDFTPHLLALAVFVGLVVLFQIVQKVIIVRLGRITTKTKNDFDDVIVDSVQDIRPWVYNVVALYGALLFYSLPTFFDYAITGLVLFAVVWQLIEVATKVIDYGAKQWVAKDTGEAAEPDPDAANVANLIKLVARILLWSLGLLFVLGNLGIEVTTLIAGLGIGGVAVAFALQGILSDLFASFSIYFDKPFRIGDFIIVGEDMGVVEKIGIKSTRLRTLQGEELVISNNELVNARVHNFKKMRERRIVSTFGITYDTPHEKVRKVGTIVTDIFAKLEGARLDRVHFHEFGDSALEFEMVFFITSSNYAQYMDIRQDFNFQLMERFAAEGIQFAYPTQTIYTKAIG